MTPAQFGFHAKLVHVDSQCRRLSFADRNDESPEHYFIMDRSEESLNETTADMEDVYIERDDQCWGGYGGIDQVVLARDSLTLHLGQRMAEKMGGYDSISVDFTITKHEFDELQRVLSLIMRGHERKLVSA